MCYPLTLSPLLIFLAATEIDERVQTISELLTQGIAIKLTIFVAPLVYLAREIRELL